MAKEKTVVQTKNKYRLIQYSSFGGELLSILAPYITLGIINFDEWFANDNGWKVGLGGSLALAILGIAVFLFSKKKENEEITGGYISLILGWFAVAFIFFLLASIMDQIATIMFFGGLGLCGGFGLDLVSKKYKQKADEITEIIKEVEKDTTKETYRQQLLEKARKENTVKVRIK